MSVKLQYDPSSQKKVLVEFSNGIPVDGAEFSYQMFEEKRTQSKCKDRKMLLVKGKHVNYVGNNFEVKASHPYACKYALAKINRKTNIARVYDTDIFKLKPILKSNEEVKKEISMEKNDHEKEMELAMTFGTKRSKRRQLNAHIDTGSTAVNDVESVTSKPDYVPLNLDYSNTTSLLPLNTEAQSADEVYPLFDLVPNYIFDSAASLAERFACPTEDDIAQWKIEESNSAITSDFVMMHLLNRVGVQEGEAEASHFSLQLYFIILLINVVNSNPRQYKAKGSHPLGETTGDVKSWVDKTFFEISGSRRLFPKNLKDKAVATVVALAWRLGSYSFKVDLLQKSMTIPKDRLPQIIKALGGIIKNNFARLPNRPKIPTGKYRFKGSR